MKSQLTWHDVQSLENCFYQPTQTKRTRRTQLNNLLNNLWQTIVARLAVSDEPRVWKSQDDQGCILWNAYDPRTGRSVNKMTTAELQVWLEERHYQMF
jgi:hypothetical protein